MARKTAAPKKTESNVAPDVQAVLERAFTRVRRSLTAARMNGGRPVSDIEAAKFVENAVVTVCDAYDAERARRGL